MSFNNEAMSRKRRADYLLLAFAPIMILGSFLIQLIAPGAGLMELYGWNALIVESLIVFVPAIIFIIRNGGPALYGFKPICAREWVFSLLLGVGLFFIATAVNSVTSAIFYVLGIPAAGTEIPVDNAASSILAVIYLAIAPGIAEETLFRGAIMRSWLPFNPKAAVFHSALLFALVHFQLTALPALIIVGLMFSYASFLTGSVYTSIAMHFSYNASAVALSALISFFVDTSQISADDTFDQISQAIDAGGASTIAIIIGVLMAAVFYIGIGFLIAHPSYKALIRASAKRKAVYAEQFKDLKAKLSASESYMPSETSDEIKLPRHIVSWQVVCAYILLIVIGFLVLGLEMYF